MLNWHIHKAEQGLSLQQFLSSKMPQACSLKAVKRQIDLGKCRVNGMIERFGSRKLAEGDRVQFNPDHLAKKSEKKLFDPVRILYEDDDLLAYNKLPGIITDERGILTHLKPYGQFFLVHRLDKETSGVLLLAKRPEFVEAMIDIFRKQRIHKEYLALTHGHPKEIEGKIENYLGKIGSFHGQTMYGIVPKEKGLLATTRWSLQKISKKVALIKCVPETGRTHQLRVHLKILGHPIVGDYQYGRHMPAPIKPERMLLHASSIGFMHPTLNKKLFIKAPLPDDFQNFMQQLW